MSGPFGSTAWMANPSTGGFYGHTVGNSVRFETGSNGHLTQTLGTAANRQINTTSFWVKRSKIGANQSFFVQGSSVGTNLSDVTLMGFEPDGNFQIYSTISNSAKIHLKTTRLFRDVGAWMHICVAIDTTQGTDTNRVKIYFNGVLYTGTWVVGTYPSQNDNTYIFSAEVRRWGRGQTSVHSDGYFAQIAQISGVQHAVGDFGELKNDIWIPKNLTGLTYAAGSYLLEFKNSAVGTASSSTVGADTSGNGLNFTSSGLAVHDQVPDSPTNNFGTLNSIAPDTTGTTNNSFSEGNLKVSTSADSWWNAFGTIGISSGKYYWEYYALGSGSVDQNIGVCTFDWYRGSNGGADSADAYSLYAQSAGVGILYTDGATGVDKGSGYFWTWGNIMSVAFDADTGKIWYAKNGTFLGSGDPAAGSNEAQTVTSGDLAKGMLPVFSGYHTGGTPLVNFGQDSSFAGATTAQGNADGNGIGDFYYAPPSGYVALCTSNLPAPVATVDPAQGGSPQDYFSADIFTGNGTNQDIDAEFNPDLIWTRQRTDASGGLWMDRLRGTDAYLQTTNLNAEGDLGDITFATNGYTVTGNSNLDNEASHNYVGWSWKAGGDGSSNTDGTINTTKTSVSANGGFSISTYTGTGSNATVGHGLSSAPTYVMVKERNGGSSWVVGTPPFSGRILFESNEAIAGNGTGQWQATAPSSTVVTIGTHASVNRNDSTIYVMYCYADVDGMQKSGKYTGNGDADGTFVYTGFRPAFVLIKNTGAVESWNLFDTARDPYNLTTQNLNPNVSNAESDASSGARAIDILSNGFKLRGANSAVNSGSFIYLAFAEQPFKYSNAR